jgi:hypothetical protein
MRLDEAAQPSFANHQTFHPRFGWVKKAYDGAKNNPEVFNDPSATVALGVGKNMVEAIRFWGLATHVIERQPKTGSRVSVACPTNIGRILLDDDGGWDAYLEDSATLWVLHWQALSAVTLLPVWWIALNDFSALEFSEADLLEFAVDEVAATSWTQPNISSIQKDVDCLLRMYAPRESRGRQNFDDLLDSPFREIGLISMASGSRDRYRFVLGAKPGLPAEVVAYCCLDYLARMDPDARTCSLTRLANDPGSPGRLLKLTEGALQEALEQVVSTHSSVQLGTPAGVTQLAFQDAPADAARSILFTYYATKRPMLSQPALPAAGAQARRADRPPEDDPEPAALPLNRTSEGRAIRPPGVDPLRWLDDLQRAEDAKKATRVKSPARRASISRKTSKATESDRRSGRSKAPAR